MSAARHTLMGSLGIGAVSAVLLWGAAATWLPISVLEAFGFATGALCVWLVTRENHWNWPIGLANNLFFGVMFWQARLFADSGLQVVYFGLGVWGWWNWLRGGVNHAPLRISLTSRSEWLGLGTFLIAGTWGLRELLLVVNGSAPFWDALTTILSLGAQYLLCRKRLEHWWLWIVADVIYVPLYCSRQLPLTALLYAGFIGLCIAGLRNWRRQLPPRHAPCH